MCLHHPGHRWRQRKACDRRLRRGNAVVEYALVLALIVVVCIGNLRLLGANSSRTFETISRALESGAIGHFGPPQNGTSAPQLSTAGIQAR